jgi:hypothetical protein
MSDRLVTIGSYENSFEANLVKSKLEAFGIDAVLADGETIRLDWLLSNALGGIKVQVPEAEVEEAHRVLQSEATPEQDEQGMPSATNAVCPACGSANTHYFLDKRGSFLTWLVFAIPLLPARPKNICADCGCSWKA